MSRARFGVPEALARWLEENLAGAANAQLRWQLRHAFKQVQAWEEHGKLAVQAAKTPAQAAAVREFTRLISDHLRTSK